MNKIEKIKDKIFEKLNREQPHDLEAEIGLAVRLTAKEIFDEIESKFTMIRANIKIIRILGFEWEEIKKKWK